jgi:hypothetical protein
MRQVSRTHIKGGAAVAQDPIKSNVASPFESDSSVSSQHFLRPTMASLRVENEMAALGARAVHYGGCLQYLSAGLGTSVGEFTPAPIFSTFPVSPREMNALWLVRAEWNLEVILMSTWWRPDFALAG